MMNDPQRIALAHPCLLGEECVHPRYHTITRSGSVIVTVNTGYE